MEERIKNLENLVYALIKKVDSIKFYTDADINGDRQNIQGNANNITANASDIADAREGLIETYDATLDNTNDISDLRDATIELYEMITEVKE